MKLVQQHIIKPSHKDYQELDHLLLLAKNLYNKALYEVRQYYFQAKDDPSVKYKYLNYYALDKLLKKEMIMIIGLYQPTTAKKFLN